MAFIEEKFKKMTAIKILQNRATVNFSKKGEINLCKNKQMKNLLIGLEFEKNL